MKKIKIYFLIGFLLPVFFSSCGFHAGFPFICFSEPCVKNQWKKPRAAIKKAKKKYSKYKSETRKKNLSTSVTKSKKQNISPIYKQGETEYKFLDSLEMALLLKQQLTNLSACTTKRDSITIVFSANDEVIPDAYKDSLSKFIHKLIISDVSCITLKGYCDSTETDNRAVNLALKRALSTFQFLKSLGIPANKMAIKNTEMEFNENQTHNLNPTIKSLQKTEIGIYW